MPGVLDAGMLGRLRDATDLLLDAQTDEQKARNRSQGSMFRFSQTADTVFAELIALPAALDALARLGFTEVTYTDGYIISKPPHSPQLFWHYDWFAWAEPQMFTLPPPQVFCMYYLTDTCRENGCLRVIPGSHTRHNPLHHVIDAAQRNARHSRGPRPEFGGPIDRCPGAGRRAGDRLPACCTPRIPTEANGRTVLTLWYQPDYPSLPERVKADGRQDAAAGRGVVGRGQGHGQRPPPRVRRHRPAPRTHAAAQAVAGSYSGESAANPLR